MEAVSWAWLGDTKCSSWEGECFISGRLVFWPQRLDGEISGLLYGTYLVWCL